MASTLLSLQNIALSFGGAPLLVDAELNLGQRERVALVGRNGSGKSTLLKIAAGLMQKDDGTRFVQPGTTLQYLPQEPDLSGYETTLAFVCSGLGPDQDPFRGAYLLEQLGLSGKEDVTALSGGEARRAALAWILAPQPDILLLDEPTNHLDLGTIEWLEQELSGLKSALIIISHDRAFLSALTTKTLWLDRGITRQLNQGFAGFEKWRDKVLEEEQLARHKLDRKIVREEHWLRYGVTARRKRNVRRLGELHNLRKTHAEYLGPQSNVKISVSSGKKTGTIIIDAKNLSKTLGDKCLVKDFSLRVMRGDRVAIVGPNGAGKTTLINLLTSKILPDSGEVQMGGKVQMAFLDQTRTSLPPETTLKDALSGGGKDSVLINGVEKHIIGYMKDFLFVPEQINTPLKSLSGGERARVMLARGLALPSNLLVLDEPTNDLDLETLDLLQETVANYPGTVIIVSHDRDFIDRVATLTIISEGDGKWTTYAGGYSDMIALRGFGVKKPGREKTALAKKAPAKGNTKKSGLNPVRKKTKLSFNQLHTLKTLPEKMATLETEMGRLQSQLADPEFYSRDPEQFAIVSKNLVQKQQTHDAYENQWLELEILREEIDNS